MLRCYVLDDEVPSSNLMTQYIHETPFLSFVGVSNDPLEFLEKIKSIEIDLLFIDMEMPRLSGFDVLDILKPKFSIIMATAFSEYAAESYDYQISDYLIKPINYERFLKAVTKVFNTFPSNKKTDDGEQQIDFVFVKTEHRGKFKKINFNDILYVEGLQNYIGIHLKNQDKPIITYIRIGEIENSLPKSKFLRVHKSYIVALDEIEAIDGNEIILKKMPKIPTNGSYKENLLIRFKENILVGNQKKGD